MSYNMETKSKMKTILNISVLTFLLVAASSHCFAEMLITDVSRAKAKEMGVAIRSHKNGDAGVKVRLEFRTQGVLKDFNRVELIIRANSQLGAKRLVSAPLLAERPAVDSVSAHFSAAPSYLDASELWIVVNDPPLGGTGYRFKVKDFIEHQGPAPITDKPFERDSATGAVGSRPKGSKEASGPETPPASPVKPAKSDFGASTLHPVGGELLPEDSLSADYWQGLDAQSKAVFLTGYRHGLGPSEDHAAKPEFRFLSTNHFATLIPTLDKFYEIPDNRQVFLSAAIQICFMEISGKPQADIDKAIKQARVAPSRL